MTSSSLLMVIVIAGVATASSAFMFYALALLTGWRGMASRYPGRPPAPDADRGLGSVSFGSWGNYNNCVLWRSDDEHLHLRLPFVFRLFHPPISLPWGEVASLHVIERGLRRGWVTLTVGAVSLTVPPKAAQRELTVREQLRHAEKAAAGAG